VTLHGQACGDAAPLATEAPFPLVIISHGYPGNRYLMSHLGENLASKGFVTVSIDHKESTYGRSEAFASTLYNRAFDQLFVLIRDERLRNARSRGSFSAAGSPPAAGASWATRWALRRGCRACSRTPSDRRRCSPCESIETVTKPLLRGFAEVAHQVAVAGITVEMMTSGNGASVASGAASRTA